MGTEPGQPLKVRVTVSLTADLEEAVRLGQEILAARFLERFQQQGEIWLQEVQNDPLLQRILRVEVGART